MKDIDIDIFDEENEEIEKTNLKLPENFIAIGNIEKDGILVYIKQDVYKRIEKFAKEEMSKEVGSILLGDYTDKNGKKAVVISDYIEAKYTDASASTLTFTHKTWDWVYQEKDKKYPDKKIVGWQHTHPGYGIFLSSYDVFIQENFFNLPWQIAYVVDPIADTRGFFWNNNEISKMSGFYVYDNPGRKIILTEKKKSVIKPASIAIAVLSCLLCLSVIVSIFLGVELAKEKLDHFVDYAREIKNTNVEPRQNSVHIVEKGDTLEGICQKYGINYETEIENILKINNIRDRNKIYVGQYILLTVE